jgi:hypothetical protein
MSAAAPQRKVVLIGTTPKGPIMLYIDTTSELIPVPGAASATPRPQTPRLLGRQSATRTDPLGASAAYSKHCGRTGSVQHHDRRSSAAT